MIKASVLGWYGHGNVGDESYKLSFPKAFPHVEFDFNNPNSPDVAIVGGGDILNEHFMKAVLATPAKKKLAMSVCVNSNAPFDLIRRLDQIFVRDLRSQQLLAKHGIESLYMPDISTCLEPNVENGKAWISKSFADEGLELYKKRIGIVFNAHLNHGPDMLARDHLSLLKATWDLGKLMDETSASFILFPMSTHGPWDDRSTNSILAGRCKFWRKNLTVYERLSVQQTLDLISACDAVISSRLHSSIFSLTSAVPFIDITHHDKNKGFMDAIGLQNRSIPYWHFEFETAKRLLHEIIDSPNEKERIKRIAGFQRRAVTRRIKDACFV